MKSRQSVPASRMQERSRLGVEGSGRRLLLHRLLILFTIAVGLMLFSGSWAESQDVPIWQVEDNGLGGGGDACDTCIKSCSDRLNSDNKTCGYLPPGQSRDSCYSEAKEKYDACKTDCCATEPACSSGHSECN